MSVAPDPETTRGGNRRAIDPLLDTRPFFIETRSGGVSGRAPLLPQPRDFEGRLGLGLEGADHRAPPFSSSPASSLP